MLPCKRGVHVHKSTTFKKTPEAIQINYTNDAKVDPKPSATPSTIHPKDDAERHRTYYPKYHKLSDFGSHFGTIRLALCWSGALFLQTGFQNLCEGTPWTNLGLLCWKGLGASLI